ncbi:hypothetical protein GOP47_0005106 [Adiantum capillus-veneris]|uniref:Uncharacterized protein n=1 Tax=Adiantum capillus-veneris TaxID=13818 RepID=A0A9D4ZMX8_ADICA|nr:hypothetical protein GOP47_0005106 [Adiantum capillus-veneris]
MTSTSSPCVEPGTIVHLRELHSASPLFRTSGSFRVMGRLLSYDIETGMAVICEEDGTSLQVATQHLRDLHLRTGSLFQFIGELNSPPHQEVDSLVQSSNIIRWPDDSDYVHVTHVLFASFHYVNLLVKIIVCCCMSESEYIILCVHGGFGSVAIHNVCECTNIGSQMFQCALSIPW